MELISWPVDPFGIIRKVFKTGEGLGSAGCGVGRRGPSAAFVCLKFQRVKQTKRLEKCRVNGAQNGETVEQLVHIGCQHVNSSFFLNEGKLELLKLGVIEKEVAAATGFLPNFLPFLVYYYRLVHLGVAYSNIVTITFSC